MEEPVVQEGMPVDLLLVRHGESEGNVAMSAAKNGDPSKVNDERYKARSASDWWLSPLGRDQAQGAGRWISSWMGQEGDEQFDRY